MAEYLRADMLTTFSATSIRGEHRRRGGNIRLKRALYLSAFASLRDQASREYDDRKRAEGEDHRSALICLARRRTNVLYAMPHRGTPYRSGNPTAIAA
ncbi:hypothetical protein CH272_18305 [Rhodococcus sp. 05-340-1]|nr:hypothetical protein CH254_14505 [Rhodococcus sp. 06-412-2C]OZC96416.1 hypothetical protein CH279_14675 [Rhodococcus sp. 06-412-2B]OZD74555.1 hypothetical protein CH272_18305 [Rhodococcus sp. 05-340-1]